MPSFDTVLEADMVEVKNALDQTTKQIRTRFDLKDSSASVELTEQTITVVADNDFQLKQVRDVLNDKLARRGVDIRYLDEEKIKIVGGDRANQILNVRDGIPSDVAKKVVGEIKSAKMKVQASVQGQTVRVSGSKRDELQKAIALLKDRFTELPLTFQNFRH